MKRTLAVLSAAMLISSAAPASAHTQVADSSPKAGSSRMNAPSKVWVAFGTSDQVIPGSIQDGTLKVFNPCGVKVHEGSTQLNASGDTLTREIRGSRKGTYVIRWLVTASDGAEQKGKIEFKVTSGKSC